MVTMRDRRRPEPSRSVRARSPLTEDSLLRRGGVDGGSADARAITRLLEAEREESRRHARRLQELAPFWIDPEDPELADSREERSLAVAIALRTTSSRAAGEIRGAHVAIVEMPRTFARLAAGEMPREWHGRMLRECRDLTPFQRDEVDSVIAGWDLASIPAERFRDELRQVIAWQRAADPLPRPEDLRDVVLEGGPEGDGTASLRITGPIPEVLDLARRLDAGARAVQAAQRRALDEGAPVPFDLDGTVAGTGRSMSLAQLRYAILLRSVLDTGGVEVPAPRFRLNVLIPVLTLMGLDDTPATLDGTHPLPAEMARDLAAAEPVWHRVFTDPISGEFLPLPAERYRPTEAMVEHLRLRDPLCAVPGCTRHTTDDAETDHLEEFDHADPARGGPTSLQNLHRLHWGHHDLKTAGRIDPVREPDGSTTWTVGAPALVTIRVRPRGDLATPRLARALQESWEHHRWHEELEALERSGELERMLREWGPPDPREGWMPGDAVPDPPF